ncbi:Methionyl-tRNA formyltransferase [Cryptotrichosporon argae]
MWALAARARPVLLGPCRRAYTATPLPPFRILFCGSDDFSVAALDAVVSAAAALLLYAERAGLPATPLGGHISTLALPTPFSERAEPEPKTEANRADLLLTASFGHIIPAPLLARFPHSLNVHPSLLPAYRGAAPVQWAITRGETETGVSVQTLVERQRGVDAGEILGAVGGVPIKPEDTYATLLPRLAGIGGALLVDILRRMRAGTVEPRSQDAARITRAPKITPETARVAWARPAADVERLHRAIAHQQPLWATLVLPSGAVRVQLLDVRLSAHANDDDNVPGTAVFDRATRTMRVKCADGWVEVARVKAEGGKAVHVGDWWNGLPPDARKSRRVVFE